MNFPMARNACDLRFGTPAFVIGQRPLIETGVWFPVRENTALGGSVPLIRHIVSGESLPG